MTFPLLYVVFTFFSLNKAFTIYMLFIGYDFFGLFFFSIKVVKICGLLKKPVIKLFNVMCFVYHLWMYYKCTSVTRLQMINRLYSFFIFAFFIVFIIIIII